MLRSSIVEETANPWSPSSTYINVGSLQNILTFAEKSGHIDRVGIAPQNISLVLLCTNDIYMKAQTEGKE